MSGRNTTHKDRNTNRNTSHRNFINNYNIAQLGWKVLPRKTRSMLENRISKWVKERGKRAKGQAGFSD